MLPHCENHHENQSYECSACNKVLVSAIVELQQKRKLISEILLAMSLYCKFLTAKYLRK